MTSPHSVAVGPGGEPGRMCRMCEGLTLDETLDETLDRIDLYGFTLQGVEPPPPPSSDQFRFGWIYTVGLSEHLGHPEMIMAGTDLTSSHRLLTLLADSVVDRDERFAPHHRIDLGSGPHGGVALVGHVHRDRLRDSTFATCHNLIARGDFFERRFDAVQIIVPPTWPDDTAFGGQRDLSLVSMPRIAASACDATVSRMDRASRRRRARGRH